VRRTGAGNVRRVLDLRDLAVPVVGAPMAGGPSTPELAAAVSAAGGLGFVAAGYRPADRLANEIARVREITSAPFGVNLFVIEPYEPVQEAIAAYRESLEPEAARLDVGLGEPRWDDDGWQAKLEVVLDARPAMVSFTFGCPSRDVLRLLAQAGVHAAVTVTTADEAREAEARGAASLCVQGPEAGGHRGIWNQEIIAPTTPMLGLLAEVTSWAEAPVVAAGGIMDAAGVDAVLRLSGAAAQVGTAFLLADEAGTNPIHRTALADGSFTRTAVTRAFTGRWGRGLANQFMLDHADAPAGYPHLHHLTAPLRAAAVAAGDTTVAHFWAGTGFAKARAEPAAEITKALSP
jgi:nitronate monooxygenase